MVRTTTRAEFRRRKRELEEEFGKGSDEVRDRLNDEDYYEDSDASNHTLTSEISTEGSDAFMSEDDEDTLMTDRYSQEGDYQSKRTTEAKEKKYAATARKDSRLDGSKFATKKDKIAERLIWDDFLKQQVPESQLKDIILVEDDPTDTKGFYELREDQKGNVVSMGPGLYRLVGPKGQIREIYGFTYETAEGHTRVRHLSSKEKVAMNKRLDEIEAAKQQGPEGADQ